jgi:hypothetical protein
MTPSADTVALVQTASIPRTALISTPAGAVADRFDRRIVGLAIGLAAPESALADAIDFVSDDSLSNPSDKMSDRPSGRRFLGGTEC